MFIYRYADKIKVVTYFLMHLTVAFLVAYILSGNIYVALGIGLIEPSVQSVAYWLHEKIWNNILK